MRQGHPEVGLGELCRLFGVSRQAYYALRRQYEKTYVTELFILNLVDDLRKTLRCKIGGRKLLLLLSPKLQEHGIKIGRDQLYNLLRDHGRLLRKHRRKVITTNSHHWLKKYPNLIKGLVVMQSEQLWVSDITYIRTLEGFNYLSLITDAYSRKIVGFCLYPTLEATGCINALEMALKGRKNRSPYSLVHHSDKGVQYCCSKYVDRLNEEKIRISMAGSPYENAIAERINETIKDEFSDQRIYKNYQEAECDIEKYCRNIQ